MMDPVTSPLIHKDSGHQARVDPGEETPSPPFGYELATLLMKMLPSETT
jgi:hypothetical protein